MVKQNGLKSMDRSCKQFVINDSDISYVKFEQVIGIEPEPNIFMKGERMFYKFPNKLYIFERR